ncbi:hypothetical protein DTL42_18360 [Bremerella cremea]|uniref:Uncharacterized protein n=1 Tax=Bremerella cremea TaxID=1031537 RepID=A0A368KMS0_9BACT|nr:hypothetical protein DTL42_18360 [Bremerella cremea]
MCLFLFTCWTSAGWAQEESDQEIVARALETAQSLKATTSAGKEIDLIATPLLRYGDPARQNEKGFLWAWGKSGRPVAVCEMFINTNQAFATYVLTLTSDQKIHVVTPRGNWQPQKLQLQMEEVEKVMPPAETESRRLQQMRQIMRGYAAHEFWDPNNSRYELRLLTSPVYRYEDKEAGIEDGALFVFAHGTNPEIVALVEAHHNDGKRSWKVGFVPVGSAELHVTQDEDDVWSKERAPGITGQPSDPYWLFLGAK